MTRICIKSALGTIPLLCATLALASDTHKQTLTIAPGGVVNVVSHGGSVALHPGNARQVTVSSTTYSDKVEVDTGSTSDGKRVDIRTHVLSPQNATSDELKIDYEIAVPTGISITVNTSTASITIDNLNGDFSLSSDTGPITVRNLSNAFLHVHSLTAPVFLSNLTGVHAEIMSSGGPVQLLNVTGPKVRVSTTSGNISYQGDCSGGGTYRLVTHNGAINVILPETASVDLSAQSAIGTVENDFPLREKSHLTFIPTPGRSFEGTSHSGSSSVELQSFSGKIRVKKQ